MNPTDIWNVSGTPEMSGLQLTDLRTSIVPRCIQFPLKILIFCWGAEYRLNPLHFSTNLSVDRGVVIVLN